MTRQGRNEISRISKKINNVGSGKGLTMNDQRSFFFFVLLFSLGVIYIWNK